MREIQHPNAELPGHAACLDILQAGLEGAEPEAAVRRSLRSDDCRELARASDRLFVVGTGKAGAPMARAVERVLADWGLAGRLGDGDGLVVVKEGHLGATERIELMEAAHPVPDVRSVEAARRILRICERAGRRDVVLCLISGGGSALMEWPVEGVSLEELREVHEALVTSGVPIDGINAVRKHLSRIKGGRLAETIGPARCLTLVVSDVVGNPLDVIASGPTVGDTSSFEEAMAVLREADLVDRLPEAAVEHLRAGVRGDMAETPGPEAAMFDGSAVEVVADRTDAVDAARERAEERGWEVRVLDTEVEGEAREVGAGLVERARELVEEGAPEARGPLCLLAAGESTVTVRGEGLGGRNQEVALGAAVAMADVTRPEEMRIVVGSLATDGGDGPAGDAHGAAGGIVDGGSFDRGRREGLEATRHLAANDAYHFLAATGDLLVCGPTLTNVNDLMCVLVWRE